jgi:sialic acid synthase
MRSFSIAGELINDESECYVIAEIGHNHQGNVETAKKMFLAAKQCGAKAVKLQKRDNRSLYTEEMYNKPYDSENSFGKTYGEHREFLEFGLKEYKELQEYAKEIGITFFATAFDFNSADFLQKLNVPAFKMASGDLKNIPLLKHVASFKKPTIISTGGATIEDVSRAYETFTKIHSQLCILQCTASYPCNFEELNLRVISKYRELFPKAVIGLSGHDNGIAMSVAAYTLGARVIEKHFTLDRSMKGTDHAFSLERVGLSKMVRDLNRTRVALGDGVKRQYASEEKPLTKMQKKIVAAKDLPKDHVLTVKDLTFKSPGDGLPPYELENLLNKVTVRALKKDESISLRDVAEAAGKTYKKVA